MIDPEEERERFISIREVVAAIAKTVGKTEQQAAAILLSSMTRHDNWRRLPLFQWSRSFGCIEIEEPNSKLENRVLFRLQHWAETGNQSPSFSEMMDDDIPF